MAAKPLHLVNGWPTEVEVSTTSAGSGDAGKVVGLNGDGHIDPTMLPPGVGGDVRLIEASETLAAGDYVNIHDASGEKVRKADASTASAGEIAHGFVLDNVTSGDDATVYFEGSNTSLSGLTPGLVYVLSHSTPGGVLPLSSATTTAGHALQVLGVAVAADTINTEIGTPTIRG